MDKFTVDLDQVLNDFEYSELTDQQSKNASEKPQSSTAFQPLPVTKHSINNVFHSLNEYINSEISSSSSKAALLERNLEFERENVEENDNNLINNVTEPYSKVKEPSDEMKEFNNTLESTGQSERLLKLKNEPQVSEISGKTEGNFEELKDSDSFKETQLDQAHEDVKTLNLLELADEIPSNTEHTTVIHQDTTVENKPTEKSNEDVYKTDNKSFSLLDMDNVEPELIPKLNCTENNIESEVENVNNDKECDKNIDNKADNKLDNEQTNALENESFLDVNECTLEEIEDNHVNISKINENNESVCEKTESNEANASYDNVPILENVENFVIEPSASPYALGQNSQSNRDFKGEEITIPSFSNNDERFKENEPKLDSSRESLIKNSNESENDSSHINKQISENPASSKEELSTNISEIKEDNHSIETSLVEDNSPPTKDKPEKLEQESVVGSTTDINMQNSEVKAVVGFSTELDIDDSELNKMLEDLEIEEGSGLDENIAVEDHVENQERKFKEENSENVADYKNNVEQLDNYDELHSLGSAEKTEPDQTLEKPTNTKDSENQLKNPKENIDQQLIECLEIEKPSKSKKASSKHKEKPQQNTEVSKTPPERHADAKEDTEVAETIHQQSIEEKPTGQEDEQKMSVSLQKQQSHDSLTRPQDLPLNEENVATRKIDLIGSPGSTPYNNVYINKSIAPKATQDTDSDYTSSASPTFSDCSTDSTSTASTASVEDFPRNPDGASTNTRNARHKNKRSEKTAVKRGEAEREGQEVSHTRAGAGENITQENALDSSERPEDAEGGTDPPGNISATEQGTTGISESAGGDSQERSSQHTETFLDKSWLGKEAPLWIPDSDAAACLHCDMKFTVLKRRHHCRACGLVLCSKCCNLKFRLEYLDAEARVCTKCHNILNQDTNNSSEPGQNASESGDSPAFRPNPNNPLEYCSTVSPLQQIAPSGATPPSVMVPVGVLKRKGSNKKSNKSVMFCDGIAPGSDLTHLDQDFNYQDMKTPKSPQKVPEEVQKKEETPPAMPMMKTSRNQPKVDEDTGSFIPKSETSLPPTVCVNKTDMLYSECSNSPSVVEMLKNEALTFALTQNLFVHVKVINMNCCINKQAWCFATDGLINVGSDEIVYFIEYIDEESFVPKDVFFHVNNIYLDAVKGVSIKEQGVSLHNTFNFLDSKNHAGFVYIRPTFQCLENVLKPKEPYLIGILIHRWETPWAKLFPLRLILRLGAQYRYYPSPLISTRHRDSVFVEIGHTIINLLADFRNFTYTLPQIRGLIIHMEDKKTTITIPRNRYDQIMKSINNSSEHILAFAGNFSSEADSHLVCIQDTQGHENCYTTHAINIHNKPRTVTGASFIVFNGSLKSSSGLTAKSNIVEDGLMIQVPSEHMDKIRENLRNMKDHTIACGCINATSDETVNIVWGENDVDFNVGVQSPVDLTDMSGIPSIRVHNGKDHFCNNGTRLIRWTEVFILQSGEENPKNQDPVDISKVSESIAKACCTALVKYLDLLVSNSCQKVGIRVTLHVENVSYSAGSNGLKLPPIYMRSLDNELVPVLHKITSNNLGDNAIELELIFRILNA